MSNVDLDRMLRDSLRDGRAPLTALEDWGPIDDWMAVSPDAVRALIEAAAELDPALATAEQAAAPSIGIALIGGGGGVQADARFSLWIGDPAASVGCMRLLRAARAGRREIGLVETEAHGVLSVYATPGEDAAKWLRLLERQPSGGAARPVGAVLVAFAPSRAAETVERAARAYGFSPLEARLVRAFLDAPSVEAAAAEIGVGREAARDALASAMRKARVSGAAQLVRRVVELGGPRVEDEAGETPRLGATLGLSPTETRVARRLADGDSAKAVAEALNLSPQTVATYRRSVFAKTGVNRARDLARLLAEVRALGRLTEASEVVLEEGAADGAEGRLRILFDADERRVAFLDYGPEGAPVTVLVHGSSTGRTAPPPLLASLRARGRRVIVPQRPGYGLSQPALRETLATATADLTLILDQLAADKVELIARSSAPAFDFAERRPERIRRWMLVNTQAPWAPESRSRNVLSGVAAFLFDHPRLIEPFARMLGRQSRSDLVASLLRRIAADVPADRQCLSDSETLAHLVRDAQSMLGVSTAGFVSEQKVYVEGWTPPQSVDGENLILVRSEGLNTARGAHQTWPTLTRARAVVIPGAGWFVPFTHPEALASLLDD